MRKSFVRNHTRRLRGGRVTSVKQHNRYVVRGFNDKIILRTDDINEADRVSGEYGEHGKIEAKEGNNCPVPPKSIRRKGYPK